MTIHIHGATEHNLQSVNATINDGLTVVTGVSGSGKTSLIFDTLYHEARCRFAKISAPGSSNLRSLSALAESIIADEIYDTMAPEAKNDLSRACGRN